MPCLKPSMSKRRLSASKNVSTFSDGQVAGGVVEEHVFRAVVNGQAVGDERVRDRLGEIEDLLPAQRA